MIINRTQLQEILIKAHQYARLQAKEAGAFIYYIKDGKRIREDAQGWEFEIIFDQAGNRQELDLHD
ncbi:hypothetical protein CDO73_18350 [Saccharibacillus sp. O23]|uniref:hypothetical protein n=1 Tax=Saccharibacillus sp. O23 TaxID=2009338 RepID=UPI000B4E43DC|nr:hypothetical protein [Saccharibacillus sp. O23]OWR28511.1 hypothetical protein CDO73_18350 [Saccharibacillus sp. O23]